jgi:hypothetical protein
VTKAGGGRGPKHASQRAIAVHVSTVYGGSDWQGVHRGWKRSHGLTVDPGDGSEKAARVRL